ncbi:hypothetical protein [Nonomuraea dietziae]|uniref:hypothetical protein n=1 Tax=Nonomuraea dietziae TaxID=65515 RepID=UPI0031E245E6
METVLAIAHGNPSGRTVRQLFPQLDEEAAAIASPAAARSAVRRPVGRRRRDRTARTTCSAALEESGLPWAVVTSADGRLAKARLATAGIEPPLLLTIDDVRQGKPDPRATCGPPPSWASHPVRVPSSSRTPRPASPRARRRG